MDLSGKVAIITGSARGIGKEIALRLAEAGATVVVSDVADAEPAAEEIRKMGHQSLAVAADVTSASDVAGMVEKVTAEYGRVDILVKPVSTDGLIFW
jgi:NAD(P)-dependent dehydrogenase (short-subunit alcohol dehydrogenase family)